MPRSFVRLLLGSAAAMVMFAGFSVSTDAGKATDKRMVQQLYHVSKELAKANPVYGGHRGAAMDYIHSAMKQLGEAHPRPSESQKKSMKQDASDHLLLKAVKELSVVQLELSNSKNSASHANAYGLLRAAIGELEIALSTR